MHALSSPTVPAAQSSRKISPASRKVLDLLSRDSISSGTALYLALVRTTAVPTAPADPNEATKRIFRRAFDEARREFANVPAEERPRLIAAVVSTYLKKDGPLSPAELEILAQLVPRGEIADAAALAKLRPLADKALIRTLAAGTVYYIWALKNLASPNALKSQLALNTFAPLLLEALRTQSNLNRIYSREHKSAGLDMISLDVGGYDEALSELYKQPNIARSAKAFLCRLVKKQGHDAPSPEKVLSAAKKMCQQEFLTSTRFQIALEVGIDRALDRNPPDFKRAHDLATLLQHAQNYPKKPTFISAKAGINIQKVTAAVVRVFKTELSTEIFGDGDPRIYIAPCLTALGMREVSLEPVVADAITESLSTHQYKITSDRKDPLAATICLLPPAIRQKTVSNPPAGLRKAIQTVALQEIPALCSQSQNPNQEKEVEHALRSLAKIVFLCGEGFKASEHPRWLASEELLKNSPDLQQRLEQLVDKNADFEAYRARQRFYTFEECLSPALADELKELAQLGRAIEPDEAGRGNDSFDDSARAHTWIGIFQRFAAQRGKTAYAYDVRARALKTSAFTTIFPEVGAATFLKYSLACEAKSLELEARKAQAENFRLAGKLEELARLRSLYFTAKQWEPADDRLGTAQKAYDYAIKHFARRSDQAATARHDLLETSKAILHGVLKSAKPALLRQVSLLALEEARSRVQGLKHDKRWTCQNLHFDARLARLAGRCAALIGQWRLAKDAWLIALQYENAFRRREIEHPRSTRNQRAKVLTGAFAANLGEFYEDDIALSLAGQIEARLEVALAYANNGFPNIAEHHFAKAQNLLKRLIKSGSGPKNSHELGIPVQAVPSFIRAMAERAETTQKSWAERLSQLLPPQ